MVIVQFYDMLEMLENYIKIVDIWFEEINNWKTVQYFKYNDNSEKINGNIVDSKKKQKTQNKTKTYRDRDDRISEM